MCFSTVFCVSSPVFQLLCLVRGRRGAGHSVCWSLLGDWLISVEDVFSVFGLCDVLTFPLCGFCFLFRPPFFPAVVVLSLVGRSSCRPRPCLLCCGLQTTVCVDARALRRTRRSLTAQKQGTRAAGPSSEPETQKRRHCTTAGWCHDAATGTLSDHTLILQFPDMVGRGPGRHSPLLGRHSSPARRCSWRLH